MTPTLTYVLQVFELLSGIRPALPGFTRSSWQSTVRRYAKAHPEYSTLEHWEGAETSDIFYSDGTGALTTAFIERGYLDETWRDEKPDYYVEVKTTMSNDFETPFYLSKYQYLRVRVQLSPNSISISARCRVLTLTADTELIRQRSTPPAAEKETLRPFPCLRS